MVLESGVQSMALSRNLRTHDIGISEANGMNLNTDLSDRGTQLFDGIVTITL